MNIKFDYYIYTNAKTFCRENDHEIAQHKKQGNRRTRNQLKTKIYLA